MKKFKCWLKEVTNCAAGSGVRGFGDVSGNPAGDISSYAATNAQMPPAAQPMVDQHLALHNNTDALVNFDDKKNGLVSKNKVRK